MQAYYYDARRYEKIALKGSFFKKTKTRSTFLALKIEHAHPTASAILLRIKEEIRCTTAEYELYLTRVPLSF